MFFCFFKVKINKCCFFYLGDIQQEKLNEMKNLKDHNHISYKNLQNTTSNITNLVWD